MPRPVGTGRADRVWGMTPPPAPTRARRALAAIIGLALIAGGVLLTPRPLSAIVVLLGLVAASLAVWAVSLAHRARGRRGPWISAAALVATAAAVLLFLPPVAAALPVVVALVLAVTAVRLVVRAFARTRGAADRVARVLHALSCAGLAVLVWLWPDAALIAVGAAFGAALVVTGIVLIVRAARPARRRRAPRAASTPRRVAKVAVAVVAVAAVAALTVGSASLRATITEPDDFSAWDGQVPPTPGALLRVAPYTGEVPDGARALRILYATTYSDGTPALASAVVALPTAAAPPGAARCSPGSTARPASPAPAPRASAPTR